MTPIVRKQFLRFSNISLLYSAGEWLEGLKSRITQFKFNLNYLLKLSLATIILFRHQQTIFISRTSGLELQFILDTGYRLETYGKD